MKKFVVSGFRTINVFCWVAWVYLIIFLLFSVLCCIEKIDVLPHFLFVFLLVIGGFALAKPYIFLLFLIIPIIVEIILIKYGIIKPLLSGYGKFMQLFFLFLTLGIIVLFYNIGYSMLGCD